LYPHPTCELVRSVFDPDENILTLKYKQSQEKKQNPTQQKADGFRSSIKGEIVADLLAEKYQQAAAREQGGGGQRAASFHAYFSPSSLREITRR
jgi:hypothetical protein